MRGRAEGPAGGHPGDCGGGHASLGPQCTWLEIFLTWGLSSRLVGAGIGTLGPKAAEEGPPPSEARSTPLIRNPSVNLMYLVMNTCAVSSSGEARGDGREKSRLSGLEKLPDVLGRGKKAS